MKNVFKSTLIALMCVATYGCSNTSVIERNLDYGTCLIFTDTMKEAKSKIDIDYGKGKLNNIHGVEIDNAANKFKQYHIDLLNKEYNRYRLTGREHKVMVHSVNMLYSDIFNLYREADLQYDIKFDINEYHANRTRREMIFKLGDVVRDSCVKWK